MPKLWKVGFRETDEKVMSDIHYPRKNAKRREGRRKANMTPEQWYAVRNYQIGLKGCTNPPTGAPPPVCSLCARPPKKVELSIDHDHETGLFRGWLCIRCNTALGTLGDNEYGIQKALRYVQGKSL